MEGLGRSISDWLAEALDGRNLNKSEFLRLSRSDKEVFVQVTLNRVQEGGEPILVAVLNDATELKTLEAQFVQSQKMQAIGQLAGGVAHDFNNLLTAISGHCDLLLLRHDQGDPDFSDLVQINQNANRAAALVGQLLAFSRKQTLRPEVLDMRETLSDLTHLLNRCHWFLGTEPVLRTVRADKRQLEQVMMNLVVNARDAMPDGGDIVIETESVHLTEPLERDRAVVAAGDFVSVKVTDHGSGIAQDKLQKVFEPFFTTKRTGEGTGLGLSTVYGIVKQTGGFIFVDSVPGKWTCFTLLFPAFDLPGGGPKASDTDAK
ncbi:Sensor kinase CckA [Nymphon striatum]|nr:Sensor kinase CckA [Nymphon striatum]